MLLRSQQSEFIKKLNQIILYNYLYSHLLKQQYYFSCQTANYYANFINHNYHKNSTWSGRSYRVHPKES